MVPTAAPALISGDPVKRRKHRTRTSEYCIPKSIFRALTREIMAQKHAKIRLLDKNATHALQMETEQFVADIFQLCRELSALSGHSTIGLNNLKASIAIYQKYKLEH